MMLSFYSDYMEGAHPLIMEKLMQTNMDKTPGYGSDAWCAGAKDKIRAACNCPEAEIHFMVGGTQTNAAVITALLRSYEGVIAADSGHISVHEAGAIEMNGHKILALPHHQGKISAAQVDDYIKIFYKDQNHAHMVYPGMVYISHPTELGTLYTQKELEDLSAVCQQYSIPLYLDGARLGYGLAASDSDVTLEGIAKTCDVFYIGGTKVGALFGEAVVITRPQLLEHFFTVIKQQGGLLAKGRLLGIQFDTFFTDGLYFKIGRHAIAMAEKLKKGFLEKGYTLYLDSPTNQQFFVLENQEMARIAKFASFSFWETQDDEHTVVRFATSWATREEDVEELLRRL